MVFPQNLNETRHLNHFKPHLMSLVLSLVTEDQGKEISKEEARAAPKLILELWQAAKLRSWPRRRCLAKWSVKSIGITSSCTISVLEKKGFGAWGRWLVWAVFFFMDTLHPAPLPLLLIYGICVAYFTVLLLWAEVEVWKANSSVCFCLAIYFHKMVV